MDKVKLILDVAQELLKVVQNLRSLSDSVQAVCDIVMEGLSEEKPRAIEAKPEQSKKTEEPGITLEQVRSVLAKKSEAGFTSEVRGIIQKYGANRLSEIKSENFKAVLTDAEAIGNE